MFEMLKTNTYTQETDTKTRNVPLKSKKHIKITQLTIQRKLYSL